MRTARGERVAFSAHQLALAISVASSAANTPPSCVGVSAALIDLESALSEGKNAGARGAAAATAPDDAAHADAAERSSTSTALVVRGTRSAAPRRRPSRAVEALRTAEAALLAFERCSSPL